MAETRPQQIVLASRPDGDVRADNFRLEDITLPQPGPGQLLVRADYLSLDPYMRGRMDDRKSYSKPVELGAPMPGETVCTVIESNHADYAAGEIVTAHTGWRTHAVIDAAGLRKVDPAIAPITTSLGVLGMPGFTAYSGLKEIGKPAPGETLVVAAASGPVGSLVGQLAQRAGARAVGIAGGPEKCRALLDEFGFDVALDHQADDFAAQLADACPKGIDIYFENVGGHVLQAVLPLLNQFARVPVCGVIAYYSGITAEGQDRLPALVRDILTKSLTFRGFINYDLIQYHPEFLREVGALVREGGIRYREDIVDGLAAAPEAFMGMLKGRNFGKLLVKLS